jgi:hypothetical protein
MSGIADRQAACDTFLDQTKQLMTLASAFVFAPAAVVGWTSATISAQLKEHLDSLIWVESVFLLSLICGYVTIGTIAGTQNSGQYDVYRPAPRVAANAQFALYVVALFLFGRFVIQLFR